MKLKKPVIGEEIEPGLFAYYDHTHFDELDPLSILHHARYLRHLERAQYALFQHLMGNPDFNEKKWPDLYQLVKRIDIDYLLPIRGVIPLIITLHVRKVREAGMLVDFCFCSSDLSQTYTRGSRTVCKLSLKTHQPTGWSPAFREAHEAFAARRQTTTVTK